MQKNNCMVYLITAKQISALSWHVLKHCLLLHSTIIKYTTNSSFVVVVVIVVVLHCAHI